MIVDDIISKLSSKRPISFNWRRYLEESVGLPSQLLDSLGADDDWTFIIRVHGIIEAGLNHMILERLGTPELAKFISKMDTSGGKLNIVKALGLLPENARMFVRVLSTVRNAAVHDVRNFQISLVGYEKGLNAEQRRNWRAGLGAGVAPGVVINDPRHAILSGCMMVLGYAMKQELIAAAKRKLQDTMYVGIQELAKSSRRKRKKKPSKANPKQR